MKVYYNGLNLYHQLPTVPKLVEKFIDRVYENLENIEVSYHYLVLLVAGRIILQGVKNREIQIQEEISGIFCSEDNVLALSKNGNLLKISDSTLNILRLMNLDDYDYITQVSCGSKLTIALTKSGKLFNIPNKLHFENKDIVDIKTGREHCLLLDKKGNVFSFGNGSRGQLGHGCLDEEVEPKFIIALGGIKIEAIEAGGWHSCALSRDGDLYIWGWNGSGQLGLSNNEDSVENIVSVMATPHIVEVDFNIKKIGCGNRHTVVLADDGMLYGCGWNKYKQLRSDVKESFYKMTYLEDFSKKNVISIKCGPWNTLVLCEK